MGRDTGVVFPIIEKTAIRVRIRQSILILGQDSGRGYQAICFESIIVLVLYSRDLPEKGKSGIFQNGLFSSQ
jgi:hypothetical protein